MYPGRVVFRNPEPSATPNRRPVETRSVARGMPDASPARSVDVMNDQPSGHESSRRLALGAGIAVGMGIGVALGVALDNMGVGIGIGLAIGIAISAAPEFLGRRGRGGDEPEDPDAPQSPDDQV